MMRFTFLFFLLMVFSKADGQMSPTTKTGTWIMWFNTLKISEKWKVDSDFHLRMYRLTKDPNTLLLRAGLAYSPISWLELTAGYAYIEGYGFENSSKDWEALATEHRIWEQIVAKHRVYGFSFHHRLRVEQRFVISTDDFYQNRLRYRLLLSRPFYKAKPAWYWFSSYEHFFIPDGFEFDQGRLHLGLGRTLNKSLKIEAAYLRHFVKESLKFNRVQLNVISIF